MNIKLADRLVELRKEHKLSQEALAEKLGLSRQAISKWERAEASPDTDNLIALSELYGITLDELLGNAPAKEKETQEPKKEKKPLTDEQKRGMWYLKASPIVLIVAIAVYVVGGIAFGGKWWSVMWILFPLVLSFIFSSLAKIFGNKRMVSTVQSTLAVTCITVAIYMLCGMLFSLWNIAWVVFLAIPAYLYLRIIKKNN